MIQDNDIVAATTSESHNSIDALSGPVICIDSGWNIIRVNAAACNVFNATKLDLVGKHFSIIAELPIDDRSLADFPTVSPVLPMPLRRLDGAAFSGLLRGKKIDGILSVQIFELNDVAQNHVNLVEQETMCQTGIESAEHGVWDYDVATGAHFYSDGWRRMRGFAEDAVISDSISEWEKRLHPDDLEHVRQNVEDHNSGRSQRFSFEYRERRMDGSWMWVSCRGQVLDRDGNGIPTRIAGTDTDITELINSRKSIDTLQRRHKLALETSGVGVWEVDVGAQTFMCDTQLAQIHDFPNDAGKLCAAGTEYPFEIWKQSLHPDDADGAVSRAQQAMMLGEALVDSYRIVRLDGEVRHIRSSCIFYADRNGQSRFLGANRDVTEEWNREADLAVQNLRFEAAIENMDRGLSMYDANANLIVANKSYAELYGLPYNLMEPGKNFKDITDYLRSSGTVNPEILEVATTDALSVSDLRRPFDRTWRLANGRMIFYSTIPLETGGWVSIHHDITEQNLAAQQLAESEARFRDFTNCATDWCWETNAEHLVTSLTESFANSHGILLGRIIGQKLQNLPLHEDDLPTMRALIELKDGERRQPFKNVLLRMPVSPEKVGHFLVSGMPKFDECGNFIGYRGTGSDVTASQERKRLLAEAEKLLSTRSDQLIEAQKIGKIGDWSYNLGDDHVWWARETFELLGHDPETFESTHDAIMSSYIGNGRKKVLASQSEVVRTRIIKSVDVKVRRRDGSVADLVVTSKGRFDEKGDIVGFYGTIQDITERKNAEEQLEKLAYFDPLTGLANRVLFQREVEKVLKACQKNEQQGALLLLDLDRFKEVNDTLGHAAGDELLQKVSRQLSALVKQEYFLARLGGDEFAIIVPQAEEQILRAFADQLNQTLCAPLSLSLGEVIVSTSIGIALMPYDGNNYTDLLRNADLALYHAKEKGRNRFEFFEAELNETVQNKMSLSRDLHAAITNNTGIKLHYQPQVNLVSGQVTGFEALIRWNHPERGDIPPSEFIPIAESSHLICDIGIWVLRAAAIQGMEWLSAGEPPREISVNVSAAQIWHSDLVSDVEQVLKETGLNPSLLCLELTETLLVDHAEGKVRKVLKDLKALGVTLALDDFGTGYSSLGYLKELPFDKLKIDRVFVNNAHSSYRSKELLRGIIGLGRGLNMTIIAEGAESPAELELLIEIGCDLVQGYFFARPTTAHKALSFAKARE